MNRNIDFTVDSSLDGVSLRDFLKHKAEISSALISQLKRDPSGIYVNDVKVHINRTLKAGDRVTLVIYEEEISENIIPVAGDLEIIFENADILIVNKPPFLPCHPSKGHVDDTLANRICSYYSSIPDNFVFRCITRLDKDTSGLVVIAKNSFSQHVISKQMNNNELEKEYLALVRGIPDTDCGRIEKNIRRIPGTNTIKREICGPDDGQSAITEFSIVRKFTDFSLLTIKTLTGRTHQIRVHMQSIGHPLLGDWLYGSPSDDYPRQMLHCHKITMSLPLTNEKAVFEAPLPEDFNAIIGH